MSSETDAGSDPASIVASAPAAPVGASATCGMVAMVEPLRALEKQGRENQLAGFAALRLPHPHQLRGGGGLRIGITEQRRERAPLKPWDAPAHRPAGVGRG